MSRAIDAPEGHIARSEIAGGWKNSPPTLASENATEAAREALGGVPAVAEYTVSSPMLAPSLLPEITCAVRRAPALVEFGYSVSKTPCDTYQ